MRDTISFLLLRLLAAAAGWFAVLYLLFSVRVLLIPPSPSERTTQLPERPSFPAWLLGDGENGGVLSGDFGNSLLQRLPAAELVSERMPATTELVYGTLAFSLIFGLPLGLLMAYLSRYSLDFLRPFAWLGKALPIFWLALMLVLIYAIQQRLLPVGGRCAIALTDDACDGQLEHLILPLGTLIIVWGSALALLVRHIALIAFAEQTTQGKKIARLAGFLLLSLPALASGIFSTTALIESIFSWPGVGRLVVSAAQQMDYPVLAAVLVPITTSLAGVYALSLMLYALLCGAAGLNVNDPVISPLPFPEFSWLPAGENEKTKDKPRWSHLIGTIAAVIALIVLLAVMLFSNVPGIITDADPLQTSPADRLLPTGSEGHPLGTDDLGRDVQAQLLAAGKTTLNNAFVAALIALVIGLMIGAIAGITAGVPGRILSLPLQIGIDFATFAPALFVLMPLVLLFRPQGMGLTLLLALFGWPIVAPVIRAGVRATRQRLTMGLSGWMRLVAYTLVTTVIAMILLETSLSFLGMGVQPPTPSWGAVLSRGLMTLNNAPHLAVLPGILLTITLFCLNVIAGKLRDTLTVLDSSE